MKLKYSLNDCLVRFLIGWVLFNFNYRPTIFQRIFCVKEKYNLTIRQIHDNHANHNQYMLRGGTFKFKKHNNEYNKPKIIIQIND